MNDISSQTLHIVAKELSVTLNDARAALEAYAERPDQRASLEKCAEFLHSAHGALRVVEVYGAALLTEEMEHVTRYLLTSDNDQKRHVDGLDALMRSMVQLPTYLERVMSGGRDMALVLLPLLNDLRSVRGSQLLSEGTLLLLNLKSDQQARPQAPRQEELGISVAQWARRLRPRFQIGLLGYIRGERSIQNLEILAKVAEKLEQVATTQPVFQLWWVIGAVLEAVRANGLEGSATLKRLLGQADRQIKLLYELGEAAYCDDPPVDLLNNLLYYVARATTSSGRIAAVRASFKLLELLPIDDSVEQERESLSAPSVKLMRTVAAAIKEDLAKVKDVLDIFVRRGGGRSEELLPQLELLKKISDTLGVLGLGELRQRVQDEIAELSQLVSDGRNPPEEALIKVAGVLLSVEDSLDDQLVRLILPTAAEPEAPTPSKQDMEFRQVSEAVLRECIVNLARIKEAVSHAVQRPGEFSAQGFDNVPQLLRGITAGLLMLGKGRAVEIMDAIGVEVRRLIEPGAPKPDPVRLERVADAIVSIEYYMETLQSGRADPWYMLDNAESCVRALGDEAPPVVPEVDITPVEAAKTVKIDPVDTAAVEPPAAPHTTTHPLVPLVQGEPVDPQFVELFIEEAREEVVSVQKTFPLWDHNPMDVEPLGSLRRSFHTLKGSGRMVGARVIAEFAWSIENLLNRIIDKTRTRTPGMMALLRTAVAALPQLVEELETGRPSTVAVDALMARAFAYADGRDPEQTAAAESATASRVPAPTPSASAAPVLAAAPARVSTGRMDPALHEIYSKETSSHLAEIRDYLRKRGGQPAPHELPESVYRAIHTLSGSSKMAEARHGTRITEPLNRVMRKAFDNGVGLSDLGLTTLTDAVRAIDNVVSHINESTAFFTDQPALLRHLGEVEAEIDAEIARAAREREAADGSTSVVMPDPGTEPAAPAPEENRVAAGAHAPASPAAATAPEPDAAELTAPVDFPTEFFEIPPEATADFRSEAPHWHHAIPADVGGEPVVPPPGETTPEAGPALDDSAQSEDFDHEIAAIYSEEATELLDAAEASLTAWNADRKVKRRVAELQRQLHTLKGGARMAGIMAMGDLSHELETLVIQIDGGEVAATDEAGAVMQASLDELSRMRDQVSAGTLPRGAKALIRQIRALSRGEGVSAGAPTPVASPAAAAPTAAAPPAASHEPPAPDAMHVELARPPHEQAAPPEVPAPGAPSGPDDFAAHPPAAHDGAAPVEPPIAAEGVAPAEPPRVEAAFHGDARSPAVLVGKSPAQHPGFEDASAALSDRHAADAPKHAAPAWDLAAPDKGAAPDDEPGTADVEESLSASLAPRAAYQEAERQDGATEAPSAPVLPGRESAPAERTEMARVDADLLDTMLNNAGEVSIFRSRLDQQVNSIDFNLAELARTVIRLKEQLRGMEIETEAQVLHRHQSLEPRRDDFDPLELDRYSALQQYSRALAETSADVASIQGLLETLTREAQNLLTQQARVITELQNSLMRTRMVPFQRHVQRLTRLVRQAAMEGNKRAELVVQGGAAELDRQMLERIVPPLEHMLRNAVVHGIETPDRRVALGKPEVGRISVSLERDGAEVVVSVDDDGAGINVKLIREKAVALGLVDAQSKLTDEEALQLILEAGFSTAGRVTQSAGRGVGMDVVATEVKKLGGGLFIDTTPGKGSRFTIRLPFTLAISQALIVRVGEETYALPLATVEGVVRLPRNIVARHLGRDAPMFEYGGQKYRFQQLGAFVGLGPARLPDSDASISVVLIRAGEHSTALVTDELVGSREIVVKSLGPQISGIRGIAGATILGDGRIVIILDMGSLVRSEWRSRPTETAVLEQRDRRTFALVVDDSITVRRVTQRLLERNGMRVLTAKDGVDAVSMLQEHHPDIILLDIEMPRMDGYEVAAHVRNDPSLKDIPIVMITSRVSEKHRARAIELGVNDYLGKPYQESQLLDAIEPLVNRKPAHV